MKAVAETRRRQKTLHKAHVTKSGGRTLNAYSGKSAFFDETRMGITVYERKEHCVRDSMREMKSQQVSNATRTPSNHIEMTDTESTRHEGTSERTLDALGAWREVISERKLKKNVADVVPTPLA
ncbi:hypothetical protein MRX96_045542 [Rhipicephalus microplus]